MIGGLRHQIDLLAPARLGDAGGGSAVSFGAPARIWAAVTQLASIVAQAGGRQTRIERIEARIRRRHAVAIGWRLAWGAKLYDIVSIEDDGPGERYVTLIGEEARP
ncbi:MAG: head-tail adaptor protein [Parvularculaceae bacterium]|nr:head-tail adaptor protein [Parvularculaceae bacterium]